MIITYKNNCIWEDGTWENGDCSVDVWKQGAFKSGHFVGKTWENGIFSGGVFEGEVWMNGIWKGGVWKGKEWVQRIDAYGHKLRIPPSEWPTDQSVLCFQYNEHKRYKQEIESNKRIVDEFYLREDRSIGIRKKRSLDLAEIPIDRNNVFLRQIDEKTEVKRIGIKLFHPDISCIEDKDYYGKLCRTFLELLDAGRLREAEKMIQNHNAKQITNNQIYDIHQLY